MSRAVFFVSEAFRALRRSAAPSVAAIVTIVVTTLLLGVLIPVLKASGDKTQDVRDQIGLNVFLYNDACARRDRRAWRRARDAPARRVRRLCLTH